jgi:hydrogenase maturation protease
VNGVRIIGVGTPHGDDRAGLALGARLAVAPPLGCEVVTTDRPGTELIDLLAGAGAVILLDAVRSCRPPGTIHDVPLSDLPAAQVAYSSHGIGIADVVALAATLGCLPPGRLIGIEAQPVSPRPGDELSTAVAAAIDGAIAHVHAWARRLAADRSLAGRSCA